MYRFVWRSLWKVPTLPREIVPPSDPLEIVPPGGKVRGGQYHVRQKGGTISRTVGGWPFWCEEGRAKVVPATPLKLSPPALKLSVGAKYRFLGGDNFTGEGRYMNNLFLSLLYVFFGVSVPCVPEAFALSTSLFCVRFQRKHSSYFCPLIFPTTKKTKLISLSKLCSKNKCSAPTPPDPYRGWRG